MADGAPPTDRTLRQRVAAIAPYFRTSRRGLVLAGIGAAIAAATEPMIPSFMQHLLDAGFQTRTLPLWQIPLIVIGLFALRGIAGFVAQYGLAWAAQNGMMQLRAALFGRLLDAEPALYTRNTASSLINTVTFEINAGAQQLMYAVLALLRDSLTLIALLGYLLWLNWKLTLFVAVLFPAVAWLIRVTTRRLHRLTVAGQQANDQLAYVVEENVLAWRIVRLHGAEAAEQSRFARASETMRRLGLKATVAAATITPLTQLLAACALSAVIVAALWQSGQAGGSVGGFVAFVMAMLQLVAPMKHLSEVAGPITRGLAAMERGVNLVDHTPAEAGGGHAPAGNTRGRVELRQVGLRYPSASSAALEDLSFTLEPGETVALVGPSGAGKSTVVNLLPRFLEPSQGTVLLDGLALPDWDVRALRRQFALVSQDVVLINDSIGANVALGADPDRARIERALRDANLWDFVTSLPEGIDAPVGHNGSRLSGGQRQRLAIARAIYKNAAVLILDEATSALDSESERLVQQALDRLMQGRTSLVIAHRLSTIERADRILVLDAGRLVETGTHAELLGRGGLYARLHALQFRQAA
jgi:subfamily B ATP-binding cassette protein MsbA